MNHNISPRPSRIHIPTGKEHLAWWIGLAFGLGLAVLVALMIGEERHKQLFLLGAILFLLIGVIGLGRRAWILIPMGWSLSAATGVLPIALSIRDTAIIVATCALVSYRVISGISMRQRMHVLDYVLWLNLGYLMVTFVIHPVGFYAFGSETVGARTVFTIAMAAVAYRIIVQLPNSPQIASRAPLFVLAGSLAISGLYLGSYLVPGLPRLLPYLYAAVDIDIFVGSREQLSEVPRYKQLGFGGLALILVLCAYNSPRALLNPFRYHLYLLLLGLTGVLASGFRTLLIVASVSLCLSAWLHRQWQEMIGVAVVGSCLLLVVALGHGRVYEMPLAAQRALSFLPGQWSAAVTEDAETSIEERFKWWRDIIEADVIKNWWIGDGFGAKVSDLISVQAQKSGTSFMTAAGAFHNGPLSAIRFCGIFGLILFYGLMITCAVVSVRCVRQARGTILHPLAMFLAIQLLWIPVHYTFIFGAYNVDMPQQIFLAGLLRLLIRMLDAPQLGVARAPTAASVPVRRAPMVAAARLTLHP